MKSILEGRPALRAEVGKIAEVAGYLWQNGWAERNGGNITVNVTDLVDDEIRQLPAISDVKRQNGESAVYDLQGRRVEQPRSGLYIRNGKKVIIK